MKNEDLDKIEFDSWPLPEEYLTELGRIVALWTATEKGLSLFLAKMSGFELGDMRGTILFNNHTIPQKIDTLGCLVEQFVEEHPSLKGYPDALSKLRKAQSSRNKFVHSGLLYDEKTNEVKIVYATTRGRLKTNVQTVTLVDFKRAAYEIADANRAIYKVVLNKEIPWPWENK